jgi:hypothetical protein
MRSLAPIALLIVSLSVQAQSLSEHAAAAAGATAGVAAGKPLSNAITKIFGQVDNDAQKAAKNPSKPLTKTPAETQAAKAPAVALPASSGPAPASSGGSVSHRRTPRRETAAIAPAPVVAQQFLIVPVAAPVKHATEEELALIKVGTTERDLIEALGRPSSRISIPEEGHMLETYQYRANGRPLATIRLDNGQVVTIDAAQQP